MALKKTLVSDESLPSQDDAEKTALLEKKKAALNEKRKKNFFYEILRFVVTGFACTLIDFFCQLSFLKIFENNLSEILPYGGYFSFAIAITVSFFVSSMVNFFLSRIWVFQDVDSSINTNNQKTFWFYVALGAGGWFIGLAIQEFGVYICNAAYSLNLSLDVTKATFSTLFQEGGLAFWAFVAIFIIKTCVTMVYNYLTRKILIFKAPKKVASIVETNLSHCVKVTTPITRIKASSQSTENKSSRQEPTAKIITSKTSSKPIKKGSNKIKK